MKSIHGVLVLVVVLLAGSAAQAQEAAPKPGVAVTVYNQGYAVVKDDREIDILEARSVVKVLDVAQSIDPTSVYFRSLTNPQGTTVLEQNYEYDLVSADKLLEKYIDQPITVRTEGDKSYAGTLMSFDAGQIVLKQGEGVVMIQRAENVQDIQFGSLPAGLLTRPTLVWTVATDKPGKQLVRIAYQTTNMDWHADYNVVANADDTKVDVSGWVTVSNQSGTAYKDARLKLIAGDVRRIVAPPPAPMARGLALAEFGKAAADAMPEEKAFFEYHMYTFPNPTTLNNNQVKQLQLLQAADVGVEKVYLYEATSGRYYGGTYTNANFGQTGNKKVKVILEVANTKGNNLGMPLPAGKVRVFKKDDADGSLEFVGEDRIDHTKVNDRLKLYVGNAFDLNGERRVTDFKAENARHWMQETVEITLTSAKDEEVSIKVEEHLNRSRSWKITDKSDDYTKEDANTIDFVVKVPPKKGDDMGKKVITYTVEYTW